MLLQDVLLSNKPNVTKTCNLHRTFPALTPIYMFPLPVHFSHTSSTQHTRTPHTHSPPHTLHSCTHRHRNIWSCGTRQFFAQDYGSLEVIWSRQVEHSTARSRFFHSACMSTCESHFSPPPSSIPLSLLSLLSLLPLPPSPSLSLLPFPPSPSPSFLPLLPPPSL